MEIKLLSMTLNNFKGTEHYELSANGNFVNVYGKNRSGKTTLADAFRWLLFDKNSNDEKSFGIKNTKKSGIGMEHGVEMVLSVDGNELKLKKVYAEKWTRKRGAEEKEFTGHETSYWINDVPSNKGEYETKIKSLIAEDIFKTITDILYFNMQIKWQDRRKILVALAGDLTDQEVIAAKPELEQLLKVIDKHSMDDYMKIVKEKKKLIKAEKDGIPARINEADKAKPEAPELSKEELETLAESLKQMIAKASSSTGKEEITLEAFRTDTKELMVTKTALQKEMDSIESNHRSLKNRLTTEKSDKERELENKIKMATDRITQLKGTITASQTRKDTIKLEFEKLKLMKFDESTAVCPTCQRGYEADKVEQFKSTFNDSVIAQSNSLKTENTELNRTIELTTDLINQANDQIEQNKKVFDHVKAQVIEVPEKPVFDTPKFTELTANVAEIEARLAAFSEGNKEVEDTSEVDSLSAQLEEANRDLQKYVTIEQQNARIEELKESEANLSKELSKYEKAEYLTEQFIKAKVSMISGKINSMFKLVEWKLFETQINGGIEECCEATFNGVPYQDLNTESKYNVGLDIINKLTEYYGVSAPIFIDNAESVTNYMPTNSQLIRLYVSPEDKTLRAEVL